jgi:hypothetical protein
MNVSSIDELDRKLEEIRQSFCGHSEDSRLKITGILSLSSSYSIRNEVVEEQSND